MGDWESSEKLLSAFEILVKAKSKNKKFAKRVLTELPQFQDFCLFDISAASKGFDEDQVFASDGSIRLNIRRGNSALSRISPIVEGREVNNELIVNFTEDGPKFELGESVWVRRGLSKFFDIYKEFLGPYEDTSSGTFNASVNSRFDQHKKNVRRIIFKPVEDALLSGSAVTVYKTNKANGENAQVSYFSSFDAWVVSSKNVSMIVRSREDCELYRKKERFQFAHLIAEEWFNYIDRTEVGTIQALKAVLDGHTLVGEYVGHNDYQHLVKYDRKTVVFYALVDNNSKVTCVSPILGYAMMQKFGLDCVKVDNFGTYRRIDELYAALDELFTRVAQQSIEDGEEGSVLYFVRSDPEVHPLVLEAEAAYFSGRPIEVPYEELKFACSNSQVLTLAKLKTLEYRVWRKLREKLKNFAAQQEKSGSASITLDKFKKETNQLIGDHILPQPLEYYYEIAAKAYKVINKNPTAVEELRHHYVDFLAKVINDEEFIVPVDVAKPVLSTLLLSPPGYFSAVDLKVIGVGLGYGILYVQDFKTLSDNSRQPSLYVSHNFRLPIDTTNHIVVMIGFTEHGRQKALEEMEKLQESDDKKSEVRFASFKTKNLSVRLDECFKLMATIEQNLRTSFPSRSIVIQDGSTDTVIEAAGALLASLSSQLPQDSVKAGPKTFVIVPLTIPAVGKSWLVDTIRSRFDVPLTVVSSDLVRRQVMNDFMRSNRKATHDTAFEKTIKSGRTLFNKTLRAAFNSSEPTTIVFIDKNHPPSAIGGLLHELNESCSNSRELIVVGLVPSCQEPFRSYPFSLHTIIQCLLRMRDRIDHPTLQGPLEKRVGVLCMFIKFFSEVTFDDYLEQGFHSLIEVPFTDETEREYPIEVIRAISAVLDQSSHSSSPKPALVQELFRLLDGIKDQYAAVDPSEIFVDQLNQVFASHSTDIQSSHRSVPTPPPKVGRREESKHPDKPKRAPTFIGLDLVETLGEDIMNFIKPALNEILEQTQPTQEAANELREILNSTRATAFTSNGIIGDGWTFPNSLHMTVLFLGNKYKHEDSQYFKDFVEGQVYTLELTQLLYVPRQLICASARFIGDSIPVKNAKPHVTLMLNQAKAKMSNMFLEAINMSTYEADRLTVKVERKSYDVYVVPLVGGRAQYQAVTREY